MGKREREIKGKREGREKKRVSEVREEGKEGVRNRQTDRQTDRQGEYMCNVQRTYISNVNNYTLILHEYGSATSGKEML